jgi:beta-lactam-binding protein with PASTA domain
MSTTAALDPPRSVLEAGREGTATLSVRNDSEIVEEYSFQVVGDPAEWARVDPPGVTVYPGQSATAVVAFKPPRSSAVPAGENPYGIHVLPAKRAENATVPEGVIEVLPFYETVAELSPQTARGKGAEQYRVSVANRGNAPVAVALAGKSASDELGLTLGESRRTVEPGTTWTSELRAEPAERLWRGTPTAYPFTVMVMPEEGPQIALAGTQYQEPVLPVWLPKALLALAVLAVLATAYLLWPRPQDPVQIPPLAGQEVSAAEAELRGAELVPRRVDVSDDEVARDRVVGTEPAAGTTVEKGSTVALRVSTGPGPTPSTSTQPTDGATSAGTTPPAGAVVPDGLVGRPEADVRQALESAGLVVGSTRSENSSSVPQDHVIATEPAGGSAVESGSEVQLIVSTGQVTVPQLEGLSVDQAIAALEADEVRLSHEVEPTTQAGVEPGQVVDQSVDAGQSAPQGSTITLTVAEAPIPGLPDEIPLSAPPNDVPVEWPTEQATGPFEVTSMVPVVTPGDEGTLTVELVDPTGGPSEVLIDEAQLTDLFPVADLVSEDSGATPGAEATGEAGSIPIRPVRMEVGEKLRITLTCDSPAAGTVCSESLVIDGEFE